jgi:hypothetical protein
MSVIQRRQDSGLALEPREPLGIAREGIRQNLQSHVALEPRVARAIDLSHSPAAQKSKHFV